MFSYMKYVLLLLILTLLVSLVSATQVADISIQIILNDVKLNNTYKNMFRIENLDYISGVSERYDVILEYWLNNYSKSALNLTGILKYKTSGTGQIHFNESGLQELCGNLSYVSVNDTNLSNSYVCKQFVLGNFTINNTSANQTNVSSNSTFNDTLPEQNSSIGSCNVTISIKTSKQLYSLGEKITFYNILSNTSFEFNITYWVEDLFSNIVKEKVTTSNLNAKSFTPSFDESDAIFVLKNNISSISCNNIAINTTSQATAYFKGVDIKKNASLEIETIYLGSDSRAKFGGTISVKLLFFTGEFSSEEVRIYIEDSSSNRITQRLTRLKIYGKNREAEAIIPLILKPNCDKKYINGLYMLFIEAFELKINESIRVEGIVDAMCQEKVVKESTECSSNSGSGSSYKATIKSIDIIYFPENITSSVFDVIVDIGNNAAKAVNVTVWSYIYKGSQSYPKNRTTNKITTELKNTERIILKNVIPDMISGSYKLMVKANFSHRKTLEQKNVDVNINIINKSAEKITAPLIKSFYTRQKKSADLVKFNYNLENTNNTSIELLYCAVAANISDSKQINSTTSEISTGQHFYVLNLLQDDHILDTARVHFNLTFTENTTTATKCPENTPKNTVPEITGSVVYNSTKSKSKNIIAYILIFTFAVIAVVLVLKRKSAKGF